MESMKLLGFSDITELYKSVVLQIEADSELLIRRFKRGAITRDALIEQFEELNDSLLSKIKVTKNFIPKFACLDIILSVT